jgi:hypothetical protein
MHNYACKTASREFQDAVFDYDQRVQRRAAKLVRNGTAPWAAIAQAVREEAYRE